MNPRVTVGFVAALALMALLVVGLERFGPAPIDPNAASAAKPEEITVFQFDDRQVTSWTGRAADKSVRMVKDGENWTIADTQEPANRFSLTSLIIRMSQLKGTKSVADASNLQQFGLAEPRLQMTVEMADGTTHSLQLGDRTPTGGGTYARKPESNEVYVINPQIATDVERLVNEPKEPPTPTPRPTSTPTPEGSGTPFATPSPAP